jgi:hypothetical protein
MLYIALDFARVFTQRIYIIPSTPKFSVQRELTGFQARHRFEDLVALNQKSVMQYESQLNSPLGAHSLSHFFVKELGNDLSFRYVFFLELRQTMRL